MTAARWTSREAPISAPARRDDVAVHEIDGEAVIALPGDGTTYHLNRTALAVWKSCDGARTTRAMAAGLADAYDVEFDRALNDVEELVVWLGEADLLRGADA